MISFHSIIISFALTVLGKYKLCKVEKEKMKLTVPVFKEFFFILLVKFLHCHTRKQTCLLTGHLLPP